MSSDFTRMIKENISIRRISVKNKRLLGEATKQEEEEDLSIMTKSFKKRYK